MKQYPAIIHSIFRHDLFAKISHVSVSRVYILLIKTNLLKLMLKSFENDANDENDDDNYDDDEIR